MALRLFFSTDGESIILKEALHPDVLKAFKDAYIDYMKGGPSATSHLQPLDVSANFRDVKTGVKQETLKRSTNEDSVLRSSMQTFFSDFSKEFPDVTISSDLKRKILNALQKFTSVLRGKYFTPAKMRQGFIDCGQSVENPAQHGGLTVSVSKILDCVSDYKTLSVEDKERFMKLVPPACAEFRLHGEVTNEFLDKIGCPKDKDTKDRDKFPLHRRDATLITHVDSIRAYQEYNEARKIAKDPETKKKLAEVKAQVAILAKEMKEKEKKDAAEEKKAEQNAEKERRKNMSVQERNELMAKEKAEKAMKASQKAQAKKEQDLATNKSRLEAAEALGKYVELVRSQGGSLTSDQLKEVVGYPRQASLPVEPESDAEESSDESEQDNNE